MTMQSFSRFGIALFLGVLISGCTFTGPGSVKTGPKASATGNQASGRSGECGRNRSSCMHEGSYESGERAYAEQEAKDLNRAALAKFRRSVSR